MTRIELTVVTLMFSGIVGAMMVASPQPLRPYLTGLVFAPGAAITAYTIVSLTLEAVLRPGPWLPPCRNQRCEAQAYTQSMDGDSLIYECACGDRYRREGPHMFLLIPGGGVRPYLRWRTLRGWRPDLCRGPASAVYR